MLGLAGLLAPPAWLLPAFIGAAAWAAIGGPMQDVTVAVGDAVRRDDPQRRRHRLVAVRPVTPTR